MWSFIRNVFRVRFFHKNRISTRVVTRKNTGILGEAYIYELLLNSGKFKTVKWNMLNSSGTGNREIFMFHKNIYFISPSNGKHYDIFAETFNNKKIYIEVKSTRAEYGSKIPFYISKKQIEMMKRTHPPNEYLLAIVFDVYENPKHFFMTLKK